MAQEQPTQRRRRDIQDTSAQLPGFVGPFPNMLSLPHGAAKEGPVEIPPFLSFLPPNAQGLSVQHQLSSYPHLSELSFPFLEQYKATSPSTMTVAGPSNARGSHNRANSSGKFEPYRERGCRASVHELLPILPTVSPAQKGHKRSRLPLNDVGRKAPRKSTASSPPQSALPQPSSIEPVKARGRPAKQDVQRRNAHLQNPHKSPTKRGPGRPKKNAPPTIDGSLVVARESMPSASTRIRHVLLDDEDEYEDEDNENDMEGSPLASVETSVSSNSNSISTLTDKSNNTRKLFQTHPQRPRSRPRYEYSVPQKMESIHKALGKDNWVECLALVEKKLRRHITEEQFVAAMGAIFSTFDEQIGRKVVRQMIEVVSSVLKVEAEKQGQGRQRREDMCCPL